MGATYLSLVGLVTEFRGTPPNVPIADGVDIEELKANDPDPMFVTLRVAKEEAVSANGRFYDVAFVRRLREQILAQRPVGNQGHIPDDQRSTLYPSPSVYWIGAIQEGKYLWAKAYVPQNSPQREEIRIRKATGGKMSTSIYGTGEQVWDNERQAYKVQNFVLESIDLAPAERAGVADLATVPHVTSEMTSEGEKPMTEKAVHEVIGEMTLEQVKFMPVPVVETIIKGSDAYKVVAELRGMLGDGDLVQTVRALHQAKAEAEKAAVEAALVTEIAAVVLPDVQAGAGDDDPVKSVRALVGELVRASLPNPANATAVKEAVAKVVGLPHVSTLIKGVVVQEMGPNQRQPIGQKPNNPGGEKFFVIPEEAK